MMKGDRRVGLVPEQPEYSGLFCPVYYEPWVDFMTADPSARAAAGIEDEPVTQMWFAGGRGSCKSSFISLMVVTGMIANPDSNAIVFRKHQTDIKDSVYSQIYWAIEKLGLVDMFYFLLSPARIIYRPTGQKIYFYGSDDAAKRKSIKPRRGYFKYLWLEELDQFAGMAEVRKLRQSVFRGGDVCQSFYSYNPPPSMKSWVNEQALKREKGKKVYRSDYRDIVAYHPEWLGDTFVRDVEALKQDNYDLYRHEYLGEPIGTGSEVFSNVSAEEIPDSVIDGWAKTDYGMDFGFTNDPTAIEGSHYDTDRRILYVFDEWYAHHQFIEGMWNAIESKGLAGKPINGDAAADLAIGELNARGAHIHRCCKDRGWPDAGMRWLRSRFRIVVDPVRCPNILRELTSMEFDKYADGSLKPEYPDRDNHGIDALRYGNEIHIRNEVKARVHTMPKGFARGGTKSREEID